jgi:uncharacterized damage-inducible protein DinB
MNALLIRELKFRLIESGIHRIILCLEKLSEEQIHFRPNTNSNSINNQVLHLDGNVRQWLIATFTNRTDGRERDTEFDPQNQKSSIELIEILRRLEADVRSIFPLIQEANLEEKKEVQCYFETQFSIVVHVIEHFSYHHGQITYITKMLLDIDTEYYAGDELNETSE